MTELPEPSNRITTQSEFDAAPPRKRSSQGFLKEADIEFISKDLKQDLSEVRAKVGTPPQPGRQEEPQTHAPRPPAPRSHSRPEI